ncbi:hypothetical protein GCM10010405_12930 [Streptomyces macrosporus]|uniref:Uncharacterized protein n=1 Tax=Streptomyces macrosporus TaxID=44032 RepID=A0ABP5WMX2_9ACTN
MLDDHRSVATTVADWSPVADRVEVVAFPEHVGTEDELAAVLADFDIVVTLRERVPFPASPTARLPRLKLLVASACATPSSTSPPPNATASPCAAPPVPPPRPSS